MSHPRGGQPPQFLIHYRQQLLRRILLATTNGLQDQGHIAHENDHNVPEWKTDAKFMLVQQAFSVHRAGKMLVPIIDDAHLMPADCLRKLRLLCEDFPRSHNLVLIGQPPLLQSLTLTINEEIRSRITYSALLPRLAPETVEQFILDQLDRAGLGHNTFTPEALALVVRSGEGLLRRTRNLCLGALIEAVRDQTRIVDLKQVNRVLIQPHWRKDCDQPIA
jgi:type II secretory pathway predicted ATPase ExeA